MCQKKGLLFAILGLFLQTKGGFEEQLGAKVKCGEEKLLPQSHGGASRGEFPQESIAGQADSKGKKERKKRKEWREK
jgi:hypothetical protein